MTTSEGPRIEILVRRLAETPEVFRREPRHAAGHGGGIDLAAIVHDLLVDLGWQKPRILRLEDIMQGKIAPATFSERARIALVLAWLLHDDWFLSRPGEYCDGIHAGIRRIPERFCGVVKADSFIDEPDRREELARLCLRQLGLRPAGETDEQAADRLASLDSIERANVIRETRAAEKRARDIREAMARKAAEEAAATYGRE